MVGDPKQLSDLARIEAALSIKCRACGHQRVYDREALSHHLSLNGGVPAWSALHARLPCRCGASDLALKPIPYAGPVRDPEQRQSERVLIALAVAILNEADTQISSARADTIAVRLALRVLLPHISMKGSLVSLWKAASRDNPTSRASSFTATLADIRVQLSMMGRLD